MVEDCHPITSVDEHNDPLVTLHDWQHLHFDDRSRISVLLPNMALTSSKMAVDEAHRRIVDHETRDNSALRTY